MATKLTHLWHSHWTHLRASLVAPSLVFKVPFFRAQLIGGNLLEFLYQRVYFYDYMLSPTIAVKGHFARSINRYETSSRIHWLQQIHLHLWVSTDKTFSISVCMAILLTLNFFCPHSCADETASWSSIIAFQFSGWFTVGTILFRCQVLPNLMKYSSCISFGSIILKRHILEGTRRNAFFSEISMLYPFDSGSRAQVIPYAALNRHRNSLLCQLLGVGGVWFFALPRFRHSCLFKFMYWSGTIHSHTSGIHASWSRTDPCALR